jgi:16S rRNA (guanine966-N2)-methyltransferase
MRFITGKYKVANFKQLKSHTRPTSASIVNWYSVSIWIFRTKVLDLYAGTGSFGLAALSRGAIWVDFVEFAIPALTVILKNVQNLGCSDFCHIWRKNVFAFLRSTEEKWDVIFLDPPYNKRLLNPTLELIFDRDLLIPKEQSLLNTVLKNYSRIYKDRIINFKKEKPPVSLFCSKEKQIKQFFKSQTVN